MSKKAYFTIDDSPSDFTKQKVDILLSKKVPTLFFCRGDFMEKDPESIIYAIKNGFVIGNHAYSHTHFAELTIEQCVDEISKTDDIINNLYKRAEVKRPASYFRYPFGTKGNIRYGSKKLFFRKFDKKFRVVDNHLKKLGYQSLRIKNYVRRYPEQFLLQDTDSYWTKDICEWQIWRLNAEFSMIMNQIDVNFSYKNGNEILLVHDHNQTHEYFEPIVDKLISKGFEFLNFK